METWIHNKTAPKCPHCTLVFTRTPRALSRRDMCYLEVSESDRWSGRDPDRIQMVVDNRLNYEDYTGLTRPVMLQRIAEALVHLSTSMPQHIALFLAEPRLQLAEHAHPMTTRPRTFDEVLARVRSGEM